MDMEIVSLVVHLVENDLFSIHSLLVFLIGIVFHVFWNYIRPIKTKVDDIPDITAMKEALFVHAAEDNTNFGNLKVTIREIEKLLEKIENNQCNHKDSTKDTQKDIEQIKQMLAQFQGHMMYGSSRDFGNKEL